MDQSILPRAIDRSSSGIARSYKTRTTLTRASSISAPTRHWSTKVGPATSVAADGWAGLKKGRAVVVPGLFVKLAMQGLRFTPRRVAARISERSQTR